MVKAVLSSWTTAIASGDDSVGLMQMSSGVRASQGQRILAAVAKGGSTICVEAVAGDVAPVAGSYIAKMDRQVVEVKAGSVAPQDGSFCVPRQDVLLLQRTYGLNTAGDFEAALGKKKAAETTTTTTMDPGPNEENFNTYDFGAEHHSGKKVVVNQCPEQSSTLTQTMEVAVSTKGGKVDLPSTVDQAQVCACRKLLVDVGHRLGAYRLGVQPRVHPSYRGDRRITGMVNAYYTPTPDEGKGRIKTTITYDLKGLSSQCSEDTTTTTNTAAATATTTTAPRNSCQMTIHNGLTCDEFDYGVAAPWSMNHDYVVKAGTDTTSGAIDVFAHGGSGRTLVVHDTVGTPMACVLLPVPTMPDNGAVDSDAECKQADTRQKQIDMAKMINHPTLTVPILQETHITGWEHCSKAWIIESACAAMVQ